MGSSTAIQWCDATQNFWTGCTKVSPGCAHCYAERLERRWGRDFNTLRRAPDKRFNAPLTWKQPQRVFTCSMSDFFHADADEWREDAWAVIRQTPHLTYQILTKRPERIAAHLPADWGATGYPNVWLGVSAEYDRWLSRAELLSHVPAAVHFLSCEPLLGPLGVLEEVLAADWREAPPGVVVVTERWIDWVVVGGESGGHEARPCGLEWIREVLDDCRLFGVPCFVKQLGSVWAREHHAKDWHGGDPAEWPADLRVRQFPEELR